MDRADAENTKTATIPGKAKSQSPAGFGFQKYKKRTPSQPIGANSPTPLGGRLRGVSQRSKRQRKERRSPSVYSTSDNRSASSPCYLQLPEDVYGAELPATFCVETSTETLPDKHVCTSKGNESVVYETAEPNISKLDASKEHTFLREAFSKAQSSWLWLDWLSQIAIASSVSSEDFTWALKFVIGILHVSGEPFLGHLRGGKTLAILELSRILEQTDLSSKRQQLTDFIEKYKMVMAAAAAAAAGASDSEKNSNFTAKATSTDTDLNSSSENAMLVQDATSTKSPSLFLNEHKTGTSHPMIRQSPPTEIVPEGNSCREKTSSQQSQPLELCTPLLFVPALALSTEIRSSSSLNVAGTKISASNLGKQVPPTSQSPTVTFNRSNTPIGCFSTALTINKAPGSVRSANVEMRCCDSACKSAFEEVCSPSFPCGFPKTMTFLNEQRAGVLPMPETTLGFQNTLIPPKVTEQHLQKPVRQLASDELADDHQTGLLQIQRLAGMQLPNGHHRFLVIPNHGQSDGIFQLTQRRIEAKVKEGSALPLDIDIQGIGMTETGNVGQYSTHSTYSATHLEDMRKQDAYNKTLRPPTQCLSNKDSGRANGMKKENDRWIMCLLTSLGNPSRPLFRISGYVNSEIWVRMPATIPVTQFEDKTTFKQQFPKAVKLGLSLDEESHPSQVSLLFDQNLVAIACLPGFNLVIVPIYSNPHNYNIEVFMSPQTSDRPAIE